MLDMANCEEIQNNILPEIMTTPRKNSHAVAENRALQQHVWGSMRGSPRAFSGWDSKPFQKDRGSKDRDYVVAWGICMFILSICCVLCMLLAVALPFFLMDGEDAEADRVFLENWWDRETLTKRTLTFLSHDPSY